MGMAQLTRKITHSSPRLRDKQIVDQIATVVGVVEDSVERKAMITHILERSVHGERIEEEIILNLSDMIVTPIPDPTTGDASRMAWVEELLYRGMFALESIKRLSDGLESPNVLLSAEKIFFDSHVRASEKRMGAANTVDILAHTYGRVLSWSITILDKDTLPECRNADGKNFRVDRKPKIGWPGAVIMSNGRTASGCRCKPEAPIEGAPFLN